MLLEEFLRPLGISQYRLAQAIDVPESRINAIVKGRRAITADSDLRLCRLRLNRRVLAADASWP